MSLISIPFKFHKCVYFVGGRASYELSVGGFCLKNCTIFAEIEPFYFETASFQETSWNLHAPASTCSYKTSYTCIILFSEKVKLACKINDEYGLVKGAVEQQKKNKGAVVAVKDTHSGPDSRGLDNTE